MRVPVAVRYMYADEQHVSACADHDPADMYVESADMRYERGEMMEEYQKPKLAQCPFCGGIADLRWDDDDHYLMWVECGRCGARGPRTCSADLYDEFRLNAVIEAVNLWNKRWVF